MRNKLYLVIALMVCASCAHQSSQPESKTNTAQTTTHEVALRQFRPVDLKLDEKSKARVDEAFQAVLNNDDKKAKLAYGRGYRFMPDDVQFAFDLRFRNFDHALQLTPKLSYSEDEKQMWKQILSSKPKSIQKKICDELTGRNFVFTPVEASAEETAWYSDIQQLMEKQYKDLKPINTVQNVQSVLSSLKLRDQKGDPIALDADAQKTVLNDKFFDQFRNAQRRDTNAWFAYHKVPAKAWSYQRGFDPQQAFDLYASLLKTDVPSQHHFAHRLKGIIKDMREESLAMRVLGDKAIGDEGDLKKTGAMVNFRSRYPIISLFLYLETNFGSCDLKQKRSAEEN